jgi:DNA-binding MarR family transcriptional regulator
LTADFQRNFAKEQAMTENTTTVAAPSTLIAVSEPTTYLEQVDGLFDLVSTGCDIQSIRDQASVIQVCFNKGVTAKEPKAKKEKLAKEPKPAKEDFGITRPQERILRVLAKSKEQLSGKLLAERAEIASSWITGFTFKACAANKRPALVEQGLAKAKEVTPEGGRMERFYEVTPAGRKLLEKIDKAAK